MYTSHTHYLEPTLMSDLEPTLVSCHVMSCLEPSNQGSILSQLQEHNVSEHVMECFEPTKREGTGQSTKTGDALKCISEGSWGIGGRRNIMRSEGVWGIGSNTIGSNREWGSPGRGADAPI